ncbi:CopD family protein [Adhaeribacter pallidiroseus]|uniref:Protoporphyrinogen IX oxidase n=1 Tax=Adhaeribacter pallidiroseus TaxID=2072847 RepID=A0A369QI38_9BACT|nr:CopD family protein [Adhaeribacter pallidiroseus]RDC62896.1 UPF0093 membrane protein [Adhaeribacter pallidiroseus]
MTYYYVKSLHIIFVVTWFAGLFYIVRLFIYFTEAAEKSEPDKSILQNQLQLMEKRLWYGITWPSAILTLIFGTWMAYLYGSLPGWLLIKLGFVFGLFLYHLSCHRIFKQHARGQVKQSPTQLRIWNEVATLFLVSIVFLVVLKNSVDFLWGLVGLILFAVILMLAIRIYKKIRMR